MAETSQGDEDEQSLVSEHGRKVIRPPNKNTFEDGLEMLKATITTKENDLKYIGMGSLDKAHQDLRNIRMEKEAMINRRRERDTDIKQLNQDITKRNVEISRVQSNLQYKNEERINDAIKKLEHQLKMQNFRLLEERKLVAEIDNLKRSRKAVGQYLVLKKEIESMRDRQRRMREERDHYYKKVTLLKQREDDIKRKSHHGRLKAEGLKQELDDLYEQKNILVTQYNNEEKTYNAEQDRLRRIKRGELQRRKNEEQRLKKEQFQKELEEYEASREPYKDERQLCSTLIVYLQRFLTGDDGQENADSIEIDAITTQTSGYTEPEGMHVLRKKYSEDDIVYSGLARPKSNKRNKRDRRKSGAPKVVHTPQIFSQFSSLGLNAPSNVADILSSIKLLEQKKVYFESILKPDISVQQNADCTELTDCSSLAATEHDSAGGTGSFTESSIMGSIPSTPEVIGGENPLRFTSAAYAPVNSPDSGSYELCTDELVTNELSLLDVIPVSTQHAESRGGSRHLKVIMPNVGGLSIAEDYADNTRSCADYQIPNESDVSHGERDIHQRTQNDSICINMSSNFGANSTLFGNPLLDSIQESVTALEQPHVGSRVLFPQSPQESCLTKPIDGTAAEYVSSPKQFQSSLCSATDFSSSSSDSSTLSKSSTIHNENEETPSAASLDMQEINP